MTKKPEKTDELEAQKALAEKQAESLPKSAGVLLDEARKADTRADADAQTNQAPDPTRVNIVKEIEDAQKEPEKVKPVKLSEAERERRSKLDVSNPDYINPSLGN